MAKTGMFLLFLIPVAESFNRQYGLVLLIFASLLLFYPNLPENNRRLDRLETLLLFFILWSGITSFFSISFIRSYTETLRYLAYFLIFVSIRHNFQLRKIYGIFFKKFIQINAFLLSILFLFFSYLPKLLPEYIYGLNLFYPIFGHNRLDIFISFSILLLVGDLAHQKNKRHKFLIISGLIILIKKGI